MQTLLEENPAFVQCPKCHQRHHVPEVEFLGIEENLEGHDVLTYTCPTTHQQTKATVYRCR